MSFSFCFFGNSLSSDCCCCCCCRRHRSTRFSTKTQAQTHKIPTRFVRLHATCNQHTAYMQSRYFTICNSSTAKIIFHFCRIVRIIFGRLFSLIYFTFYMVLQSHRFSFPGFILQKCAHSCIAFILVCHFFKSFLLHYLSVAVGIIFIR